MAADCIGFLGRLPQGVDRNLSPAAIRSACPSAAPKRQERDGFRFGFRDVYRDST
jgi:hypothetical protein